MSEYIEIGLLCSNKRTESRFKGIICIFLCFEQNKNVIIPLNFDFVLADCFPVRGHSWVTRVIGTRLLTLRVAKKRGLHAEMASITNSHHNRGIKKMKR